MKYDNHGFTLIELVVVIAIMGILAGVAAISTSIIPASRAKSCASRINASLDRCRTGCLTHGENTYMTLSVNSDGKIEVAYYESADASNPDPADKAVLSSGGVTVTGGGTALTASSAPIKIAFDRSSGALKEPVKKTDYTLTVAGGGRPYTIHIVGATGSHEISQEACDENGQ